MKKFISIFLSSLFLFSFVNVSLAEDLEIREFNPAIPEHAKILEQEKKLYDDYVDGVEDEEVLHENYEMLLNMNNISKEEYTYEDFKLNSGPPVPDPYIKKLNTSNPGKSLRSSTSPPQWEDRWDGKFVGGDILITNGTSSYGFLGHAAIYVGDNGFHHGKDYVLDIPGPGKPVRLTSFSSWKNQYMNKKGDYVSIYRPDFKKGYYNERAGYNANSLYSPVDGTYKNVKYGITLDPLNKEKIYCTLIIYQAYFYSTYGGFTSNFLLANDSEIILPYFLPTYFNYGKEISLVYKVIVG
ncbi:hypothetical protein [Vagococcus carniphilus]|uniref:hypothetical protein n=1 Tax=Vagococcus carniphilus TaxID=218144 RepID=UPI003B5AB4BB